MNRAWICLAGTARLSQRQPLCYHDCVQVPPWLSRDRLAVVAALVAPLALTAILVPFRTSFPNTDAALALVLVVVAVATNGYRLAGYLAALSAAVWFDFFLTRPYETFNITRRADIETGYERYTNYLRVHMSGLRHKLEPDPSRPRHLLTEPGMGYRYQL